MPDTPHHHFKPPAKLVSPYKVDQGEYERAMEITKVERDWYAGKTPYQDDEAVEEGIANGALVKVAGSPNYLPIMRFRNPDLHQKYPPYLSKNAKALLDEVGSAWREKMDARGKPKEIRLALTSMVRNFEYQEELLKAGRFAQENSPHTFGEAFDLDSAGYYVGENPMNPRLAVKEQFEQGFQELSKRLKPKELADLKQYDPEITLLLLEVLTQKGYEGKLHYIVEFAGTENEIYHVCRNPAYVPKES